MSAALVLPGLVAALHAVPGLVATLHAGAAPASPAAVDGYLATGRAPALRLVGEPYVVELEIRATGENPVEVPSWLVTPAGWLVDRKPLTRRESKADFVMQPGQVLRTELDLSASLDARFDGKAADFRIQFAEGDADPTDVVCLQPVPELPGFDSLTRDHLSGHDVVLQTTEGPIWVELWPDVAPNHVRNFLALCASGFYDGSAFHRVIPGFMVQGGQSPDGTPAPRKLEAEFNSRKHTAGVLSAARLGNDINSATSEFFIVHETSPHLDGNYTAFGRVVAGMDVVDRIVDAVSVNYDLVEALVKKGVRMDPRSLPVATAMNRPNPPQAIERAIVVEATKSRPKTTK